MDNIINSQRFFPKPSFMGYQDEYILITSLNLGGAEKIVTDQLWANSWSKKPIRFTLIVLYDKEKEHPVPSEVNIVRLNGDLTTGRSLFASLAHRGKTLVAHLINDKALNYLFDLGVRVNLVLHNDQQGWVNKPYIFNHPNMGAIVAVCKYVQRQARQYTDKPIITLRHQIQYRHSLFDEDKRRQYRLEFDIQPHHKLIGMVGRIAWQKNYPKAIEILKSLVQQDPLWKLMIVGGFESSQKEQYIYLCQLINHYQLQEHVRLTGFRNDVKGLMSCFDVALNTSHFEGLSMATQELLGNGLTVFCANTCGQGEIMDENKQIEFFPISASSETIACLISQHDSRHGLQRSSIDSHQVKKNTMRSWASHSLWNLLHHAGTRIPSKNEKVAFFTSNLNLGGAQKSLVNLSKKMVSHGIEPVVICANQSNHVYFYQQLVEQGIEVFLPSEGTEVFEIAYSSLEYLRNNNIGKLLFWNVDSKLRLLLTKIGAGWLEIIDVSPGHYCFEEMSHEKDFMQAIYFNEEEFHEQINAVVFKYHVEQKDIPFYDSIKEKLSYIPNGVFLERAQAMTQADMATYHKISELKKLHGQDYHLAVCGRIAPSKHVEKIFEACSHIQGAKLYVVGSVEPCHEQYWLMLKEKYAYLFDHHIFIVGQCDDAQYILPLFDCLIVLGTHQGCPNTVLEAFACQTPVIANDSGGTREIVNQDTGILLHCETDVLALSSAIKYAMEHPEEMRQKAAKGYALVKEIFSMQKMVDSYIQLLQGAGKSDEQA